MAHMEISRNYEHLSKIEISRPWNTKNIRIEDIFDCETNTYLNTIILNKIQTNIYG